MASPVQGKWNGKMKRCDDVTIAVEIKGEGGREIPRGRA
jgi:hypothetical protein